MGGVPLFGLGEVEVADDKGLKPPPNGCLVCVPAPMPGARLSRLLAATTSCTSASGSSVSSSGAIPSPIGASARSLLNVATELPDCRETRDGGRRGVIGPGLRCMCAVAGSRTKTFMDSAVALVGVSAMLKVFGARRAMLWAMVQRLARHQVSDARAVSARSRHSALGQGEKQCDTKAEVERVRKVRVSVPDLRLICFSCSAATYREFRRRRSSKRRW
jgi:hypothetical protein